MSTILYSVTDGVATLTLHRPDALNALNEAMAGEAKAALAAAANDPAVRVLVITGTGNHFSAGGDVKAMAAGLESDRGRFFKRDMIAMNKLVATLAAFPMPTLAAVAGYAAGGGCSLALACDFRIARTDAKFLQAFINIGLGPDTGSSYYLTRLIGLGRALEMVLTGDAVNAETALQWGLVNRVAPPESFAAVVVEFARKLAGKSPAALASARRSVLRGAQENLKATLAAESRAQTALGMGDEFPPALRGFLEKKLVAFSVRKTKNKKTAKYAKGAK